MNLFATKECEFAEAMTTLTCYFCMLRRIAVRCVAKSEEVLPFPCAPDHWTGPVEKQRVSDRHLGTVLRQDFVSVHLPGAGLSYNIM